MSLLPFSFFNQGDEEYEVVDKKARDDLNNFNTVCTISDASNKTWTQVLTELESYYNNLSNAEKINCFIVAGSSYWRSCGIDGYFLRVAGNVSSVQTYMIDIHNHAYMLGRIDANGSVLTNLSSNTIGHSCALGISH